jgi:hypothetical protein
MYTGHVQRPKLYNVIRLYRRSRIRLQSGAGLGTIMAAQKEGTHEQR